MTMIIKCNVNSTFTFYVIITYVTLYICLLRCCIRPNTRWTQNFKEILWYNVRRRGLYSRATFFISHHIPRNKHLRNYCMKHKHTLFIIFCLRIHRPYTFSPHPLCLMVLQCTYTKGCISKNTGGECNFKLKNTRTYWCQCISYDCVYLIVIWYLICVDVTINYYKRCHWFWHAHVILVFHCGWKQFQHLKICKTFVITRQVQYRSLPTHHTLQYNTIVNLCSNNTNYHSTQTALYNQFTLLLYVIFITNYH